MTTLASDIIEAVKADLHAGRPQPLNTLATALTDNTGTTVMLTYDVGAAREGSYICIDLEVMYVVAVVDASKTLMVIRGMEGSTAATHAQNAVIQINPLFSNFKILNEINADLDDLSSPTNGLYQVKEVTFTYNPAQTGYNLTGATDVLGILEARAYAPGASQDFALLHDYKVHRNADTTLFASTFSFNLKDGAYSGRDVRVTYSAPFTHFVNITDDATTVAGLTSTMTDLPSIGASLRLQSFREPQRNFNETQGSTRRAQEVPSGAQFASTRGFAQVRASRIRAEAQRLNRQYPFRRRVI